jgi:hypothetical protein
MKNRRIRRHVDIKREDGHVASAIAAFEGREGSEWDVLIKINRPLAMTAGVLDGAAHDALLQDTFPLKKNITRIVKFSQESTRYENVQRLSFGDKCMPRRTLGR